jgi:hypothetical protein
MHSAATTATSPFGVAGHAHALTCAHVQSRTHATSHSRTENGGMSSVRLQVNDMMMCEKSKRCCARTRTHHGRATEGPCDWHPVCLEITVATTRHVAAQQPHRQLPLRILSHRTRLPRRRPHTRRVRRRAATWRQRHCSKYYDDEHRRMRARSPTHDVAAIVDTMTRRTLQLMSMSTNACTKQGLDSSSGCITGAAGDTISRTPCSNAARHGHSASSSSSSTAVGQFVIKPVMSACVGTAHGVAGELVEMPRGVKRSRDAGVCAV